MRTHKSHAEPQPGKRLWLPRATAAGASGTAIVIWFEELVLLVVELISVLFLFIISGIIFLFNHLVFRSAMPRQSDLENDNARGTQ